MGSCDDKCCLCIDLRVGCLIIGYLSLVGEILALIFTAMIAMTGAAILVAENDEDSHIEGEAGAMILIIAAVLLLFLTLFLAFTIVLLVGIHQNKRGHVKAYLIYSIIFQVIYFIVFLASFASPPIQVGSVLQKVFTIALNLYFLYVVGNFYRKMDDHKRGPAIYTA